VKKVIVLLLFLTIIFIIWENVSFLFVEDEVLGQIPDEDLNSNNSIMVYSPLNEKIIIPIVKEFQETTGIQVNYLSSGTGNLLKLLEQKEDMPLMDVMWGGSREFLDLHLDSSIVEEIKGFISIEGSNGEIKSPRETRFNI